jgi:hypothetical protein
MSIRLIGLLYIFFASLLALSEFQILQHLFFDPHPYGINPEGFRQMLQYACLGLLISVFTIVYSLSLMRYKKWTFYASWFINIIVFYFAVTQLISILAWDLVKSSDDPITPPVYRYLMCFGLFFLGVYSLIFFVKYKKKFQS